MKVIVKHRQKGGKYEFVKGRERDEKGKRNLVFTDKQDEAKLWNTLYAATDFISKSDTKLEGFEIVQIDEKDLAQKTTEQNTKQK